MVGAPAVEDAVERARTMPALGVGLHLTLLDGRPVLPPDEVPGLVKPDGRFSSDPLRFGVALYFSPELRRQADAEITAQFDRFRATGLKMDHINGHKHFHLHPVVLSAITRVALRLARRRYVSRSSLSVHPLERTAIAPSGVLHVGSSILCKPTHAPTIERRRHTLKRSCVRSERQRRDGRETACLRLIDHLPDGVSEIYCHPATRRWEGPGQLFLLLAICDLPK